MDEAPRIQRDEAWRQEFERQFTRKLRDKLYRVALARLRRFAGPTQHVDEVDVDDAVMCVVYQTLDGVITWDPSKTSLERFLAGAIRYRVRDQVRARRRRPHEPIDEAFATVEGQQQADTPIPDVQVVRDLCTLADEVVPLIRAAAAEDPDVLELLDLMTDGVTNGRDIMRETKWTAATFRNIRRRLTRMTDNLPAGIRNAVKAALS